MGIADDVARRAGRVRLVVTDFDGVLTDNRVYVFEDGREAVACSRADGLACDVLRAAGVRVVILSTETNPVVEARARKLSVEVVQNCDDKGEAIRALLARDRLEPDEVAYVGNDVNDLPAFEAVPFGIAPADAHPDVLRIAAVVTRATGGRGVLREVADLLRPPPR